MTSIGYWVLGIGYWVLSYVYHWYCHRNIGSLSRCLQLIIRRGQKMVVNKVWWCLRFWIPWGMTPMLHTQEL